MISSLINAIIFLIGFLGYCLFFTRWFKWKFSTTPFFTTSMLACLTYIFALAGFLKYASVTLLSIGYILLIIWAIKALQEYKQNAVQFRDIDFSGIAIFLSLYFIFFMVSRNLSLFSYDEYSHWALAVKELLYYNQLPTSKTALTVFYYPPFPALFQYFVCKIISPNENMMYFANSLMFISTCMLLVFPKRALLSSLTIFAYFLISFNFGEEATNLFSLYAEGPLSYIFCGIIIHILINRSQLKPSKVYQIIPAIICLTLTKETGVLLALSSLLLCSYFVLKEIFTKPRNIPVFPILLSSVVILLSIILSYSSWRIYLRSQNLNHNSIYANQPLALQPGKDVRTKLTQTSIIEVAKFFLHPTPSDKQFLTNFVNRFEEQNTYSSVQTKTLLVFLVFLLGILYILHNNKEWNEISILFFLLLLTYFAFQTALLYSYRFVWNETRGLQIPGLSRYCYPYIQALNVFFLWLIAKSLSEKTNPSYSISPISIKVIALVLFSFLILRIPLPTFVNLLYRPYEPSGAEFLEKTFGPFIPEDSRVFHINLQDAGQFHYELKYYIFPRVLQRSGWTFINENIHPVPDGTENIPLLDRIKIRITPESLLNIIRVGEFNFVLISYADNEFCSDFSSIFDKPCQENHSSLYRVNPTSVLSLIEEK